MDVAVLGCGPAGLMAAHAATVDGHEVTIFSRKEKSRMGGAQYLHEPIEGITSEDPEMEIRYVKFGDGETYARKVYGDLESTSSFDYSQIGWHPAWSLSKAYDRLWGIYEGIVQDTDLDGQRVAEIMPDFQLTISSVPAPAICDEHHEFNRQGIYLVPGSLASLNTVVYSGRVSEPWYRCSNIGGEKWTEFSTATMKRDRLNAMGWSNDVIAKGLKPLSHNCDCHPKLLRVGRFGKWERGVLTHNAWDDTLRALGVARDLEGIS